MEIRIGLIRYVLLTLLYYSLCSVPLSSAENRSSHDSALDSVLVVSTNNASLNKVISGIKDELDGELEVNVVYHSSKNFENYLQRSIVQHRPNILVFLGNETINSYIAYQESRPDEKHPPALLLAALYIDKLADKLTNTTGIRYEIPLVTSAVNLRSLSSSPIKKIGVIHREWLSDFVSINAEYAANEGLEIIPIQIRNNSRKKDRIVAKSIKKLSSQVDAFWVLNDNALLTKDIILNAWIPELAKFSKPVIVGVESLVETKFQMGTLSVSPDHYALGAQAASKIFDIQYDNWVLQSADVDQPFSVKKVFNHVVSKKRKIEVNSSRFGELDRVIE